MMKILVVGGGGREHALTWKIANDSCRPQVFCAPGNAGTAAIAENLPIAAEDIDGLVDWALKNRPDLTVVGPEAPLCAGITDRFTAEGLRVFGPTRDAAQLEGSKIFAKEIMNAGGVPTAASREFDTAETALEYLSAAALPVVIKAEGLAAGKGVFICASLSEAEAAIRESMVDKAFGDSGNRVLIEEFMEGEEASILALIDGEHVVMLASSQDHKRVFNNDEGPNTGGMGAYSPAPVVTEDLWPVIREQVFDRTLKTLRQRGIVYKGVLYAGIMVTKDGPRVLEFNCRFGDPETQAVLPRIDGDLVPALEACVDGTLADDMLKWKPDPCVCVVMASGGYPESYAKGYPITGLDEAARTNGVVVFHAGTRKDPAGAVRTAGGRVLGVTAVNRDLETAVRNAYLAISRISFDQAQYRTDIAVRALRRLAHNA
jgi:phosphoribosylamine--glycine ligase